MNSYSLALYYQTFANKMELFLDKYKPRNLKDIRGQDTSAKKLNDFVVNFKDKAKKAILIYGPSGVGKSASVYAMALDLDYEVIELNSSDFRGKEVIEGRIRNAIKQKSLFRKGKIIFLDEIEGISGNADRGGLQALMRLIEETSCPIILSTNEIDFEKFESLKKKVELLEFPKLDEDSIFNVLKEICDKEKTKYEISTLKDLASNCDGDLRAAIVDLQILSDGKGISGNLEPLQRFKKGDMDKLLFSLFNGDIKSAFEILNTNDLDLMDFSKKNISFVIFNNENLLPYWIDENLARVYKSDELVKAFSYLSKADVYRGRIMRMQYYRYLVYIKDLIAAISTISKNPKKVKLAKTIRSPKNNKKLWFLVSKKKRAIAEKLAELNHVSVKKVMEDMPYFNIILNNN